MMGTMGRSWTLIKACFGVVRKDLELMLYPAISAGLFILLFLMLVGVLFFTRAIEERTGIVGTVGNTIVGLAWNLITFFIISALIFEKKGMWSSLKRSGACSRRIVQYHPKK